MLINQNRNLYNQHILPTRNKFVYSCSIRVCASKFNELLESIFCILLVLGSIFPAKIVKMLEEVVLSWWDVRWIWQMRQNFVAQFVQLLKSWLCDVWAGVIVENWALSVDWCRLQALQFSLHLIDLLNILLRCNGFAGIQKAVVDQTSSRPPVTRTRFFGTNVTITGGHIKFTFIICHNPIKKWIIFVV